MFIITVEGKEKEGAYSVIDEDGEQVLYIFADGDDARPVGTKVEIVYLLFVCFDLVCA